MNRSFIFLACLLAFIHCKAQQDHIPNPAAKQFNDRAVSTYIKYNAFPDSVIAAIHLLDKAVAADSLYYNAWTNKLGYECQLKQFEAAIKTTMSITRIFPKANDVLFFMGILQFKIHHDKEATTIFEKLVKIYDNTPDKKDNNEDLKTDIINKAIALKLIGKTEEGNSILRKLVRNENDPAIKSYTQSYIYSSKEQIIEQMVPGN